MDPSTSTRADVYIARLVWLKVANDYCQCVLPAHDMHKCHSFIGACVLHAQCMFDVMNSWRDDTDIGMPYYLLMAVNVLLAKTMV